MKAKNLRIVLPMLTVIMLLGGCGTVNTTQQEILDMLKTSDTITIELSTEDLAEQSSNDKYKYTYNADWTVLGDKTSSSNIRSTVDSAFNITGNTGNKKGCFYINEKGEATQNNCLAVVLKNQAVVELLNNNADTLNSVLSEEYVDLEEDDDKALYTGISDYFELLPTTENAESHCEDTLTRAECMSMMYKAMNKISNSITENKEFNNAVGDSNYNIFAAQENDNSFINTLDNSLNEKTYMQKMTKVEFIYLVMNSVFGNDTVQSVDTSVELKGLSNAGDILKNKKFADKKQLSSAIIKAFINDPTKIDENLYKAIVLANDKKIIDNTDNYESFITKSEAVEILCNALIENPNIEQFEYLSSVDNNSDDYGSASDKSGSEEYLNSLYDESDDDVIVNENETVITQASANYSKSNTENKKSTTNKTNNKKKTTNNKKKKVTDNKKKTTTDNKKATDTKKKTTTDSKKKSTTDSKKSSSSNNGIPKRKGVKKCKAPTPGTIKGGDENWIVE